jgi:3-hydroxyacyl-[acyl-carrier-protein] dehydratase
MRWTWIDRFVSFESGTSATAVKNLSLAEDHFADHFPGFPVMPATLILERKERRPREDEQRPRAP